MSFDGNGNYTVPPGTAAVTGTAIDSAKYNAFWADLQTALSKALLRDGQSAALANIPMGGYKLTGLAAGSVAGDSVRWEQLEAVANAALLKTGGTVTGTLGVGSTAPSFKFVVANADGVGLEVDPVTGVNSGVSVQSYNRTAVAYTSLTCLGLDFRVFTGSSPAERLRIDSSGNIGISLTPTVGIRTHVRGSGTGSGTWSLFSSNSATTKTFGVRDDGAIDTGRAAASPYDLTTAVAANMVVQSDGFLYRSTSSARYKKNIEPYTKSMSDFMKLRAVSFVGAAMKGVEGNFVGLVAEEVHAAGFPEFVQYDSDGQPDGVHYSSMIAVAIKGLQDQQRVIDDLTKRVEKLENKA